MDYEIITKSDTNFFPGLKALIESLVINAPNVKRTVIDCGLNQSEKDFCVGRGCVIQEARINEFKIQDCMKHYYTKSIYGFITAEIPRDKIVVHIDADAILLGPLDDLIVDATEHGFAAIPDYPPLTLNDQIRNPDCLPLIRKIIPELDLSSKAFNAGVFATRGDYFLDQMRPIVTQLIPIHEKLWSNDQALLNLAAFKANPSEPFRESCYKFNTRPFYNRSPETPPLKLSFIENEPKLHGIGGDAHILHFVGKKKPWLKDYDSECPGYKTWNHFYSKA